MAGADMLKAACSSSNAGHGSSHQTSSQVLGFLSVLALSGSVALLTLAGKHKQLWHYVFESPADSDDVRLERSEETGGGSRGEREECEDSEWLCSNSSSSSTSNGCPTLKKVRFAPDVVEPSGDGQEYRRRHEMARIQQMRASHQQSQDHIASRRQGNSACRTAATAMERQPKTSSSRIPANRIALYNGVMQYRRQHALHCS